ncbi:MAG: adenylyl-sulfate kinase [Pseudomonadales bacterium]|nr:adenylyl-sulfate kinase [Pseudomonadales bacterium]
MSICMEVVKRRFHQQHRVAHKFTLFRQTRVKCRAIGLLKTGLFDVRQLFTADDIMAKSNNPRNLVWQHGRVSRQQRFDLLKQHGATLWFTGLSGAGKSTLAFAIEHLLSQSGHKTYVLDGDNIRHGLNSNLGFSEADRTENIRRVGEVSCLFADAGLIVLSSFISPFQQDRDLVRAIHHKAGLPFIEVFVDTPLALCETRDAKQLYAKARRGEIKNFTGISSPYEKPERPEIVIAPEPSPEVSGKEIIAYLKQKKII